MQFLSQWSISSPRWIFIKTNNSDKMDEFSSQWWIMLPGWEPINTNIPESIGVGSQYWGVSIGIGGVLNKRIDQV